MALARDSGVPAENQVSRRNLLLAAPAVLAATMTGAAVAAEMPDDWRPDVETVEQAIIAHVREIMVLLRETAPVGAWMRGFQFSCVDGEISPETIWASAQRADDFNLIHARPAVFEGWREHGKAA
jgi:hypothetical protein